MDAKKILSADILDLVFEGRNKDYGAYELRKTYNKRIVRALLITAGIALLALLGSFLATAKKGAKKIKTQEVTIQNLKVVSVDDAKGFIFVKGAVPGNAGGYVLVRDAVKHDLPKDAPKPAGLKAKKD